MPLKALKILQIITTGVGKTLKLIAISVPLVIGVDVLGAVTVGYPPTLVFVLHELPFRGQRFDSEGWETAQQCTGLSDGDCAEKQAQCSRGRMVRNLTTRHLVPGLATRATAASLIGPAEYDLEIAGKTCDGYSLGMCSGLRWDYDSLYVCYADDGTVSSAGHLQH